MIENRWKWRQTLSLLHGTMLKPVLDTSWIMRTIWIFFEQWLPVHQLQILPRLSLYILFIGSTCISVKYNSKYCVTWFCRLDCCVQWSGCWGDDLGKPCAVIGLTGPYWEAVGALGRSKDMPPMSAFLPTFFHFFLSHPHGKWAQHVHWILKEAPVEGGGARFLFVDRLGSCLQSLAGLASAVLWRTGVRCDTGRSDALWPVK